jgi:hypothetical protein
VLLLERKPKRRRKKKEERGGRERVYQPGARSYTQQQQQQWWWWPSPERERQSTVSTRLAELLADSSSSSRLPAVHPSVRTPAQQHIVSSSSSGKWSAISEDRDKC